MAKLPTRKLLAEGPEVYLLGIGVPWFGRPWPPKIPYTYPNPEEINNYLDAVFAELTNKDVLLMIDTAGSYGLSEEKLGDYFKSRKELLKQALIATKWGEEFNSSTGQCSLAHSREQLKNSFERSLNWLKKIDILYIHRTNNKVLNDKAVINEMKKLKTSNKISYIGASFSNEKTLEEAIDENLIGWCDVIQLPGAVLLKRPDLVSRIEQNNPAIVINSPIRKGGKKPPQKIYQELISHSEITVILIGTRNHLKETIGYFSSSKSK